ncbi:MAG TPA: hypothetical protein VJZ26_11280, partial [Blastocatellia bacterium]|nr:hypothetical protein [Blastocatellia bacterium]
MKDKPLLSRLAGRASSWLGERLQPPVAQDRGAQTGSRRAKAAIICAIIFLAAFAVRQLHWQDYNLRVGSDLSSLVHRYQKHAREVMDGEGILFPRDYTLPKNVQRLVHPPGYSVFVAAVFRLLGDSN